MFLASTFLALFILSVVLVTLPIILSFRRTSGAMFTGGSNSLVISAACYANRGITKNISKLNRYHDIVFPSLPVHGDSL